MRIAVRGFIVLGVNRRLMRTDPEHGRQRSVLIDFHRPGVVRVVHGSVLTGGPQTADVQTRISGGKFQSDDCTSESSVDHALQNGGAKRLSATFYCFSAL